MTNSNPLEVSEKALQRELKKRGYIRKVSRFKLPPLVEIKRKICIVSPGVVLLTNKRLDDSSLVQ